MVAKMRISKITPDLGRHEKLIISTKSARGVRLNLFQSALITLIMAVIRELIERAPAGSMQKSRAAPIRNDRKQRPLKQSTTDASTLTQQFTTPKPSSTRSDVPTLVDFDSTGGPEVPTSRDVINRDDNSDFNQQQKEHRLQMNFINGNTSAIKSIPEDDMRGGTLSESRSSSVSSPISHRHFNDSYMYIIMQNNTNTINKTFKYVNREVSNNKHEVNLYINQNDNVNLNLFSTYNLIINYANIQITNEYGVPTNNNINNFNCKSNSFSTDISNDNNKYLSVINLKKYLHNYFILNSPVGCNNVFNVFDQNLINALIAIAIFQSDQITNFASIVDTNNYNINLIFKFNFTCDEISLNSFSHSMQTYLVMIMIRPKLMMRN